MNSDRIPLSAAERVSFTLRSLYRSRGYSQYKMNKFEEYDLYAKNKDFLISDSVITFTDNGGKLMALKPDVTLSIVKNSADRPDEQLKVYYNENVYRAEKESPFREIMQSGLECIGAIDDYSISEVISLAAESLSAISSDCVLDISNIGFLCDVIAAVGLGDECDSVLRFIGEKNLHELKKLCRDKDIDKENEKIICAMSSVCGNPETVLPKLISALDGILDTKPLEDMQKIIKSVEKSVYPCTLRIDFSVVDDINYYNGIVFKGYIKGIPTNVLSGGQYDGLMKRMGRRSGAVGFAVYMDMLTRLLGGAEEYDVDTVLLYADDEISKVCDAVAELTAKGESVMAVRQIPQGIKYKRAVALTEVEGILC